MPHLVIDNVSMFYGARTLFERVHAEIAPHRVLVVTGHNGSGKSTLLRILAGLTRPETGSVFWRDGADGKADRALGDVGYAAPAVELYDELTGLENLAFAARLRGLPAGVAEGALARVGLKRSAAPLSAYSSGMRQRLKLAGSLIGDPPLLIWDEPTATLDPEGRSMVDEVLAERRGLGAVIAIATNDAREAERWGDLRLSLAHA